MIFRHAGQMHSDSLLQHLQSGRDLEPAGISAMAALLLDEGAPVETRADLLRALSRKGESASEIAGFVAEFLTRAVRPPLDMAGLDGPAIDVCGTGGDKLDLFNVSTTGMFVLAGAGAKVVKHGNRGITSKSGGADVLEALGVRIDLPPERYAECIRRHGAGFMLAPQYHPAFKAVVPVRKLLAAEGTRTVFNLIGPLLNPLQPAHQLIGIFDSALPPVFAEILKQLGRTRAWAVHGITADGRGMDEVSTMGETIIARLEEGVIRTETVRVPVPCPETLEELQGGDAGVNAAILTGILDGSLRGAKRDLVLANAAAGLQTCGLAWSWEEGLARAAEAIDSGRALAVLRALQDFA